MEEVNAWLYEVEMKVSVGLISVTEISGEPLLTVATCIATDWPGRVGSVAPPNPTVIVWTDGFDAAAMQLTPKAPGSTSNIDGPQSRTIWRPGSRTVRPAVHEIEMPPAPVTLANDVVVVKSANRSDHAQLRIEAFPEKVARFELLWVIWKDGLSA